MREERPRDRQDIESARSFFNGHWKLYRRVLDLNYLNHREAGRALHDALQGRPFSFLDLACGDAAMTSEALRGTAVTNYSGVDISSVALGLARKNIAPLRCLAEFFESDFMAFLQGAPRPFDAAYVGLSVHHLAGRAKAGFLRRARPWIADGGCLILYEPICFFGESRDACLRRWVKWVDIAWDRLTPEEMATVKGHVLNYDYPDAVETYADFAREAGFAKTEELYRDEAGLYVALRMTA